jgi:hypothetical protein
VHIRRALLLFAIVLGMAALVASLSRPPEERTRTEAREEPAAPRSPTARALPPGSAPTPVSFDALSNERRRLRVDRAATVEVSVDEPGSVELPALGLTASADRHTPARFDFFPTRPGSYAILFIPADGDEGRRAGTVIVD